jgi:uncharacterized protein (TIGR03437 family)
MFYPHSVLRRFASALKHCLWVGLAFASFSFIQDGPRIGSGTKGFHNASKVVAAQQPGWPEASWPEATPAEVGMDAAKFAEALDTLPAPAVVIRQGKLVGVKGDPAQRGYIFSACKSLAALIAARLIQQGHITLDMPVPGSDDPAGPLATYRQFLSMTSDYRLPPRRPGERYAYNNGAVGYYAYYLEEKYFPGRDEVQMLKEAYLDALGVEDGVGYTELISGWGGGWSLSPRDLARIGYLVLRNGRWKGEQLIPEWFVHELYRNQIPAHAVEAVGDDPFYNEHSITSQLPGAYSFGFWLPHRRAIFGGVRAQTEAVAMWGAFGTTVMISRETELVIAAVNTSGELEGGQVSGATLDLFTQAIRPAEPVAQLTVINAANFAPTLAPETIVAGFGTRLAEGEYAASATPLPTELGGTVVSVNGVAAPLFFVSPTQVNFLVPADAALNALTFNVTVNGQLRATSTLSLARVAPALFTATATGRGAPAGHASFDGVTLQPLANADGTPRPLAVGTESQPTYLTLYGTGFRFRTSLNAVQVTLGGTPAEVTYAGPQPGLAGLDQLNLKLPSTLAGRREVNIVLTVDGRPANEVTIHVL